MKNRSGPSIEPWGTPHVILLVWEYVPAISTICSQSLKYDTNQFIATGLVLVLLTRKLECCGYCIKSLLVV